MPKSIIGKMLDDIYFYQHPYDVPRPFTDRQRAKMLKDIITAIKELTGEDYTGRPAS